MTIFIISFATLFLIHLPDSCRCYSVEKECSLSGLHVFVLLIYKLLVDMHLVLDSNCESNKKTAE